MKHFLAVYLGSATSDRKAKWDALDENTRHERETAGMDAWAFWASKYQDAIVSGGSPIGKTKLANSKGISETKNLITAYTIVRAETHEAAAEMFIDHPHFALFPGESIEIMECLPHPNM